MTARTPEEVSRAWRERIAGRLPPDPEAAAASIGRAYRQAGLPPPARILWADGPGEAVQAVAFLRTPPQALWRFTILLTLLGAVVWGVMALMIANRIVPPPSNGDFVAFAAMLSAFVIVLGSLRPVPAPPRLAPVPRHREILAWAASLLIIALQPVCCAALLQLATFELSPATLVGVIVLAAIFGCLPGLLLAARIYSVYRILPPFLRTIGAGVPVGGELRRARDAAWMAFRQQILFASWSDRLSTQDRRTAHALAFRDDTAGVFAPDALRRVRDTRGNNTTRLPSDWLARVFEPTPVLEVPFHYLDGIEDATRAAAVECASTNEDALAFADIAYRLDRLYPFRDMAIAVWPATRLALDGEERLHSDHGPALTWKDGTAVYLWHGRLIDADLVDTSRPLSLHQIALERDTNRRRVLIERFGLGRYLLECGAAEIQRDECGSLYRLEQRLDEPITAVRVINRTAHPDGSFETFWLRVPPSTRTAREAVAWTFGLAPDEYAPELQS